MEKAILCLSFDDGRYDNFGVFNNVLKPLNIPITINITTGYIDGTCPVEFLPSTKKALSIENTIELFSDSLCELALHGDFHRNTINDISNGREKLLKWLNLPDDYLFGFASPGSGFPVEEFVYSPDSFLREKILYMRTSGHFGEHDYSHILARRLSRITHSTFLYNYAYRNTIMTECKDRIIYSVPVMKQNSEQQLIKLVDLAIKKKGCLTLMFHSIGNTENDDNWTWDKNSFVNLCHYAAKQQEMGNLEILTQKQRYYKMSTTNQ